jgi:restriction system protein
MIVDVIAMVFSILKPFIGFIFLLFLLVMLFRLAMMPKIKGRLGEMIVHQRLKKQLDPAVYHLIPDVMLPTADEGTTQIDHVIVSRYGIFVVETKTYTGWIFGSERDPQWTQSIYRMKNRFQNPLRQNYKHTKTLADLTGIPQDYFKSCVAFAGDCTFKTDMPSNVVYSKQLGPYITRHQTPIIQDSQVPEIVAAIREWAGTVTQRQKANHVTHLRAKKEPVEVSSSAPPCPLCGSTLVLRNSRHGTQFLGCAKFPACRGTRKAL